MIDGGYPKNLNSKAAAADVHVLKGGIVEFWQDIGWQMMAVAEMAKPQRQMFACFAEAMLLDFEQRHTNFSWGRNNISLEAMDWIGDASRRHGFRALALEDQAAPTAALAPA
jgi:fatty aldehyde-generating acyl-ACP reductase